MPKRLVRLVALGAMLLALFPLHLRALTSEAGGAGDAARVIVKLKADSPLLRKQALSVGTERASRAEALGRRLGLAMSAGGVVSDRAQVVFAAGISSHDLAQRLARESDVEYAVPDLRRRRLAAPNDPLYASGPSPWGPAVGQWYLRAPTDTVRSSLDIERAWAVTTGSPSVVVAVIDTGVRFEHPDLLSVAAGGNLLSGYDMISDVELANDGDGRDADASDPGDWVTVAEANNSQGAFFGCTEFDPSTSKYTAEDSSWHGTRVSGVIAALTDNGIGMASVGPHLRVLTVRALGKCGTGFDSDIIAAVRWAAGLPVGGVPANPNRARVINLSMGEDSECTAAWKDVVSEVNAAGVVIVASAGNSSGHAVGSPGNCAGVITVAALRHVGTKVGFSDLGPEIAISAPGGNCVNAAYGSPCLYPILTTSNSGTTVPAGSTYTDSYNVTLGTSFSAPLVAGTAGLMLAAQPNLTPTQVRFLLQATARPFPTDGGDNGDGTPVPQCTLPRYDSGGNPIDQLQCYCTIDTCGAGMLDAGAAVLAAKGGSVSPAVPTVMTTTASGITATGATLGGTVSSNGAITMVTFRYGLATDYGSSVTAAQSPLAAGAAGAAVSAAISGLACNTTYHFRLVATNSAGTTLGPEAKLTTLSCPPPGAMLTVLPAGSGAGTVTSTPPGIDCGTDCSESYALGTVVTLRATPLPGSAFWGWSGGCAVTGECAVGIAANRTVTAMFVYVGSEYSRDYVQKAYVAYYGRPADPAGQAYWAGRMDAEGQTLIAIIGAFGNSDEFNRRYGGLSDATLVTRIYQQALARDPDPAGLAWYVGELQAGRRTLQTITLDVLNGATTAPDSTVVANKLDVATYFTAKVAAGCVYGSEQDGTNLIAGVTASAATVTAAKAAIDARCGA